MGGALWGEMGGAGLCAHISSLPPREKEQLEKELMKSVNEVRVVHKVDVAKQAGRCCACTCAMCSLTPCAWRPVQWTLLQ